MLKWVFFDVGNVVLNDDPAMAVYYREIYRAIKEEGNSVPLDHVLAAREKSILEKGIGRHYIAVALQFLGRQKWEKHEKEILKLLSQNWSQLCPLMPDIVPVIKSLAGKYNLGFIANQPAVVADVLDDLGLLKYFKVHGFSQTVGLSKPDPEFFKWAIDQAGCSPQESIMIGDRIDNDVKPARSLGMKTLWLKLQQHQKGYEPKTEFEKKYFQSLQRACVSHLPPKDTSETPDGIAENFDEILTEIERIAKKG